MISSFVGMISFSFDARTWWTLARTMLRSCLREDEGREDLPARLKSDILIFVTVVGIVAKKF